MRGDNVFVHGWKKQILSDEINELYIMYKRNIRICVRTSTVYKSNLTVAYTHFHLTQDHQNTLLETYDKKKKNTHFSLFFLTMQKQTQLVE